MAAIPYKITVENRKEYLYVSVEADSISLEMVVEYINAYAKAMRETGHSKMLFERRVPVLAQVGKYALAAMIARNLLPADARIAVVDTSDDPAVVNGVITQQAAAAGITSKQFRSIQPALRWLLA